jgi:hypothetical protein
VAGATNSFEGGTNNSTITTGNSGGLSGTAFANVFNSPVFTNVRSAHGTLSARLPASVFAELNYDLTGSNSTRWVRVYLYSASWSGTRDVITLYASGLYYWTVRLSSTTVTVLHYNGSGSDTTIATISQAPTAGAWIRVELQAINNASGACEVRLYNSADSTTPTGTATGSRTSTPTDWSTVAFISSASTDLWIDDVGWSDVDWLGPAVESPRPRTISGSTVAVHHAASW